MPTVGKPGPWWWPVRESPTNGNFSSFAHQNED
jgi:hypothetical protein